MNRLAHHLGAGWAGVVGAGAWYSAHELGLYFSGANCGRPWIVPTVHGVALAAALVATILAAISLRDPDPGFLGVRRFLGIVGISAGALFSLVILWQGVASLVYSGCER